jgi:hypothetical protein
VERRRRREELDEENLLVEGNWAGELNSAQSVSVPVCVDTLLPLFRRSVS